MMVLSVLRIFKAPYNNGISIVHTNGTFNGTTILYISRHTLMENGISKLNMVGTG